MSTRFSKYQDRGLTGLANVGNSCYLNSCMQIFSHTYELNDFFNKGTYKTKIKKVEEAILLLEWDKLRELMWSENCTIAPWGFIKSVHKVSITKNLEIFSGYAQNDLHEFLMFIVDGFHTALSREVDMTITGNIMNSTDKLAKVCYEMMKNMYKKEFSEMLSIFFGIHISAITSLQTNEVLSLKPEPFSVMSLPIPSHKYNISLIDCLDKYCENELLDGDNAWFNEKTNTKESANRKILFWSLPDILIITIKRWGSNGHKLNTVVSAPLNDLNLISYISGYNKQSYIYDLYGICNHYGGCQGGHYTAHVKNANDKWYNFNDTIVNQIYPAELITNNSYCFFYRKKK